MSIIDAETARRISDSASFGVQEILKTVDAVIKSKAQLGFKHVECTFSKENVSRVEIDTAVAEINANSFSTELSETAQHFKLHLKW